MQCIRNIKHSSKNIQMKYPVDIQEISTKRNVLLFYLWFEEDSEAYRLLQTKVDKMALIL